MEVQAPETNQAKKALMLYCVGDRVLEIYKNTKDATVEKASEMYDNIKKLITDKL